MVAHRQAPHFQGVCLGSTEEVSVCTRCGKRVRRVYPWTGELTLRGSVLCLGCRVEWDDLMEEVARRWHCGLTVCFFCRRPLGDERFPARSPLGASCAKCGVTLSALIAD
jgi:hypothetical protein